MLNTSGMGIAIARRQQGDLLPRNIAGSMDTVGLRVKLPDGRIVTGIELTQISDAQLATWSVDRDDLWSLLRDAATVDNEGQIVDLTDRSSRLRFGFADGIDKNYARHAI